MVICLCLQDSLVWDIISGFFWSLNCKKEGKKRLTAVISDVIRLQATTLGDFTLNLIFIVSQNGTCFLTVNKTAGDAALIIDVNGLLLFAIAV